MASVSPYQHCSRCGAGALISVSRREFVCSPCGYRHFITPVPAAVALILDDEGRLLVTRRGHEPGFGKLGLPGGVIEPGETAEEAASRETLEEVGLAVPVGAFESFLTLPNIYWFQDYPWPTLDLFYLARVPSFESAQACPEEVSELFFISLAEVSVADFAFESNARAVTKLQEYTAQSVVSSRSFHA
jgi:ADP-ribose pyrophosphatase